MKFLKTEEPRVNKEYQEYFALLDERFLKIKKEVLEEIVKQKENGADKQGIEWQILKILRTYGLPLKLSDYKRKHSNFYK